MGNKAELGTFLRSRRARLQPADAGLRQYGERRRVPGLRREELAQLAGVSVDYYVRFEQGRAENVSDTVIDAVATALRLDQAERQHLLHLVRPDVTGARPAQRVRPGLRRLLDSLPDTPALVVGRRTDILAWNEPFTALLLVDLAALAPERRNLTWLHFCDERLRGRYVDWECKARDLVAILRMDLGRHQCDPEYTDLVAQLTERSPEFARLWEDQEVREKTHGEYEIWHPAAGTFTLAYETLRLPDDPDQALVVYTAEAGSPAEPALRAVVEGARPLV
ncbi:transcriptional regulator with XRE-family HTH domain [Kitasatospora gansuensis]|uniref:Transcriptional regulator with XRE-family HTH domain n=1 Tax=Kitasatospora gansuensis TaxID=258050 RepID=A0A7W7WFL4_9ACTN|nr:helix-turn-helix transcriptional regulator [Kitasatospora gansuensis]MBB4945897.1 transcriptional regulator with XRE-family HTH domain [Kitasatospora gansuensis]